MDMLTAAERRLLDAEREGRLLPEDVGRGKWSAAGLLPPPASAVRDDPIHKADAARAQATLGTWSAVLANLGEIDRFKRVIDGPRGDVKRAIVVDGGRA